MTAGKWKVTKTHDTDGGLPALSPERVNRNLRLSKTAGPGFHQFPFGPEFLEKFQ
jgi:hypothetical protein